MEGLEPVYVIEDVGEDKSFEEDLDKWISGSNGSQWEPLARGGEEHHARSNDIDEVVYSHLKSSTVYQEITIVNGNEWKEPVPFPVGLRNRMVLGCMIVEM